MVETKEAESRENTAIAAYLPAFVSLFLTVITIVLYATLVPNHYWSIYASLFIIALTPFAIVFVNRKFRLGIPQYLVILMCTHGILSVDLGTALGLYGRFPWWDTFVHAFFGFLSCATLYSLYFRFREGKPDLLDFIGMVLLVISFAAIWEVYEFVAGGVLDSDMQDVAASIAKGINPITDTMVDIVVATIGAALFEAGLFVRGRLLRMKQNRRLRRRGRDQ